MNTKPIVFIMNGSGGCGKDTFVELCHYNSCYTCWHISTITPIKEMAKMAGWNGEKDEASRRFLSDLKDLCTQAQDTSFRYVKEVIQDAEDDDIAYVFVDCREPEEIQRMVNEFGAITVYIDASKRVPFVTSNHADAEVANYNYDIYIDNNGNLGELGIQAEHMMDFYDKKIEKQRRG